MKYFYWCRLTIQKTLLSSKRELSEVFFFLYNDSRKYECEAASDAILDLFANTVKKKQ